MKKSFFPLLILILGGINFLFAQYPVEAENHYQVARGKFKAGQITQAVAELKTTLELAPTMLPARFLLGICYFEQKDWEKAKAEFDLVLKSDSKSEDAYLYLAEIAGKQADLKQARFYLERLLAVKPDESKAFYALGVLEYRQGNLDQALHLWQRALEKQPDYPEAAYNLGWAYFQKKDFKSAKLNLLKAVKLAPREADFNFALGWLQEFEGIEPKEAAGTFFKKVKELEPEGRYSRLVLVMELLDKKDYQKAEEQLLALLKEEEEEGEGESFYPLYLSGLLEECRGNLEKARQFFEKALKSESPSWQAREKLAGLPKQIVPVFELEDAR